MRQTVHILIGLLALLTTPSFAANQLHDAPSPYLRLHATDPVDWRPWSDQAFEDARRTNKPVLLSIGYLACHWCHVMQDESFANASVAAYINANFIPVLVDREARPEIDTYYQHAIANTGGATGWPLTVFLTPDRAPFWGGGYFPEPARGGMPAFSDILQAANDAYREDPGAVEQSAQRAVEQLRALARTQPGELTVQKSIDAGAELARQLDPLQGGFGDRAKFPNVPALELIWRTAIATSNRKQMGAVEQTLRHMVNGGLYDHVGGGFFRYTVDPAWAVPHFEKMLDTNAAMLGLMVEVWRETRDQLLATRIQDTVRFLQDEMQLSSTAFAAALDADSVTVQGHLEEGAYYVWEPDNVRALAGNDADAFFQEFTIVALPDGPGDGPGTLLLADPLAEHISDASQRVLAKLKRERDKRTPPRRDEKILVDWNAMAARALAEAAGAFDRQDWFELALKVNVTAQETAISPDGLWHGLFDEKPIGPATVEDIAALGEAHIALHTVMPQKSVKDSAINNAIVLFDFDDHIDGGFFFNLPDKDAPTGVHTNIKPRFDEPNPSGNARAARLLAKVQFHEPLPQFKTRLTKTLNAFGGLADDPDAYLPAASLLGVPMLVDDAMQIVIIADDPVGVGANSLRRIILTTALGARMVQILKPGSNLPDGHPAQYKEQVDDQTTVYVCRGTVCSLPLTTADDLHRTLLSMRGADFSTAQPQRP